MTHPLILHIPHSSTHIPPEWRGQVLLDDAALAQELLRMTDAHTDRLFDVDGASRIVFPVSRLLVDVERFADDDLEPMSERGMGVIYTRTAHGEILRNAPDVQKKAALLEQYYHPHHAKLLAAVELNIETDGTSLIVDCHSFPSRALPYERQPEGAMRPQICLGTDDFHTPNELSETLRQYFSRMGYSVTLNTPFAGAMTPIKLYRKEPRLRSVMIEVRRDLYMDERTGAMLPRFDEIKLHIAEGIEHLLEG